LRNDDWTMSNKINKNYLSGITKKKEIQDKENEKKSTPKQTKMGRSRNSKNKGGEVGSKR